MFSIISLVMVLETLFKATPLKRNLNYKSLEIELIGSLFMYLIFCFCFISTLLFIIYKLYI